MADATLNDVISRLRTDNEKQLREQRDTTVAIEELSGTIRVLLEQMETQRLRDIELEFERRRRTSPTPSPSRVPSSLGGFTEGFLNAGILSGIATSLSTFSAGLLGLGAAIEGFGPSTKSLSGFIRNLTNLQKWIAKPVVWPFEKLGSINLWDDAAREFSRMERVLRGRYTFDPNSLRWKNALTGRFAPFAEVERAAQEASGLFTRISKAFSAIQIPESVTKSWDNIAGMFGETGSIGRAFASIKNAKWVTKFLKFANVLAVIISVFDGISNASEEIQSREGFFNKYLGGGAGGFIAGTLGSFFGEFANLFKDIPLWLISWVVPEDWITIDKETGSWKFEESKNIFTKLLAGLQTLDFNQMIRDIVMVPFDVMGNAFDYIGELMGWSGSKEDQAAAKKSFDDWWSNWFSIKGIGENVGGILGYIVNMTMSPVNAILENLMDAFGVSTKDEESTFIEKMKAFVSWVYSFVPSVEDIKRKLATSIGPGVITDFLGLSNYLPVTQEELDQRSQDLLKVLQDKKSTIAELESKIAERKASGLSPTRYDAAARGALIAAQAERDDAQRELMTLLDSAKTSPGINQSTINNVQTQADTIFMPNSGSIDNDDIRR